MAWRAKLSTSLQELRIHLCQTSPASKVTRDFIVKNYKELKSLNPRLPILIRECSGIQPRLWARYDYGVERSVVLDGLTESEIDAKLKEFADAGPNCK
jgi:NADH dehydrogenase (ubiquinone) 1 alpha subcomplex subunit 2